MIDKDDEGLFIIPDEGDTSEIPTVPDVPKYLLPNTTYDVLKWVGLVLCPATATFVGAVGPAWGWPNVDAVVLTINAFGLFVGGVIGASHISAVGR